MVLSKLNKNISYIEKKTINPDDINKESSLYEISINGTNVLIAIGSVNSDFIKQNVVFFPIYLIKKNKKSIQIGVYEFISNELSNFLDEEGELNLEIIDEPLFYNFVNSNFIENNKLNVEEYENQQEDVLKETQNKYETNENKIPENRRDVFTIVPDIPIQQKLKEETFEEAKNYVENYEESTKDVWIQKFMKNKNYSLLNNEGGGDCLFATIRDSFQTIGQQTTVYKLREKLSSNVQQDVFKNYQEQYKMFNESVTRDTENLLKLKNEVNEIKNKMNNIEDKNEKLELTNIAKKIVLQFKEIEKEKNISKEYLKELKFMKNVEDLEKFKSKIRTCDFWADLWAISTLERILNIKFIILSSEAYKEGDIHSVLKCGQNIDLEIEKLGIFEPEYYIMVDHVGDHYMLIGYKNKKIFDFSELPFYIKKLIVEKCMESSAGVFNLIPEFKTLKMKMNHEQEINEETDNKPSKSVFSQVSQSEIKNLFNDEVVFSIYPKASEKNNPGKSVGEVIPSNRIRDFAELKNITNWRRKLDDSWETIFLLDNHKWGSVENYYQASKFKKNNKDFYFQFSLDSESKISKNPELAIKVAESKTGIIKGEQLKPKQVKIDPDFETRKQKEHYDAVYAKFSQNPLLKDALIQTKDAKITIYKPKEPAEIADDLMLVRLELSK